MRRAAPQRVGDRARSSTATIHGMSASATTQPVGVARTSRDAAGEARAHAFGRARAQRRPRAPAAPKQRCERRVAGTHDRDDARRRRRAQRAAAPPTPAAVPSCERARAACRRRSARRCPRRAGCRRSAGTRLGASGGATLLRQQPELAVLARRPARARARPCRCGWSATC